MKLPINVLAIKDNDLLHIKGKLGSKLALIKDFNVLNDIILVDNLASKALIASMIQGVSIGFKEKLKFIGVGYKATIVNNSLELALGFKNPVIINIPKNITISLNSNGTIIEGKSSSKTALSQFFSYILQIKPAYKDIYNGKGIVRF